MVSLENIPWGLHELGGVAPEFFIWWGYLHLICTDYRDGQEICVELGHVVFYTVDTSMCGRCFDPSYVVVGEKSIFNFAAAALQE